MPQAERVAFRPLPKGKRVAPVQPPVREGGGERALLVTSALSTVPAPLNSTMIAVALPDIAGELGVGGGEAGYSSASAAWRATDALHALGGGGRMGAKQA